MLLVLLLMVVALLAFMRRSGVWRVRLGQRVARFEWSLRSSLCGCSVSADYEDRGLTLHVALPPVSLWLTLPVRVHARLDTPFWARWNERFGGSPGSHRHADFHFLNVRVHHWALWWSILKSDWGWSHRMPRWMDGNTPPRRVPWRAKTKALACPT